MESFFKEHKVLLAPMAGVTDEVFRMLCIEQGAALTYTEMVSAKGLSYGNEKTRSLISFASNEEMVAVQLFGHEAKVIAQEVNNICEVFGNKIAYIDINMGCPARKIVKKGDGCALMTSPELASNIVEEASKASDRPVTVKFRRGYSEGQETASEFAKHLEQAGAAALTVHGRYGEQYYRGHADWDVVKRVKDTVSIPVVGNGDIKTGTDAIAMIKATGCNSIMIARAAQGNPWIFSQVRAALQNLASPPQPTINERINMARRHAFLLSKQEGPIVRMRKHAMWYLSGLPGAAAARRSINECNTYEDFDKVLTMLQDYVQSHSNEQLQDKECTHA